MNDYETIKEKVSLKDFAEANLTRAKRGGLYVCPYCDSGSGETASSDSALQITPDGKRFTCFSCNARGDVFDLAGVVFKLDDKKEQLEAVANWAGMSTSYGNAKTSAQNRPQATIKAEGVTKPTYEQGKASEAEYMAQTRKHLNEPEVMEYLEARGYTLEKARELGLGYDPNKKRLIIPWIGNDYYHIDRTIEPGAHPKYIKPAAEKVGSQPFYNPDALRYQAFYLCEGALDALAIIAEGKQASCLGGTSTGSFIETLRSSGYTGTVILAMDNDEAGASAAARLADELQSAGINAVKSRLFNCLPEFPRYKDPDEARRIDKDFRSALRNDYEQAKIKSKQQQLEAHKKTLEALRVLDPADIAESIFFLRDYIDPIATGIEPLDEALDGGIERGLYVLGAISSLGKTTLAIQIADHIAKGGKPVLFVTIEQSANEIAAKSLSRILKQIRGGKYSPSAREITSKAKRETWPRELTEDFMKALEVYTKQITPNLHILEGSKQPSVSDIATAAQTIRAHTGEAPVIFVDYLQLLAAQGSHDTDKQATDKNIMSLRQLARDMATSVFTISSLSRASYSGSISLDSFKESGAIEYGADVLLGLQPEGMESELEGVSDNKAKAKASKVVKENKSGLTRACEVVILKNRNGRISEPAALSFNAVNGLFEPKGNLKKI